MKRLNFLIWGLIFTLLASTVSPNFVSAKELESKESVLSESILYNFDTKKLELDEETAKEKYDFTNEELNYYSETLESLTPKEVDDTLLDLGIDMEKFDGEIIYKENENGEITPYAAMAILAGIGLVTIMGYFFWDRYLTHVEKMNFANQCYAKDGYPVVDSRDDAGLSGITDVMEARKIGGFNFACKKP
ncbi:hypothetical protein ACQKII_05490 [Lysinibacillus sp. NPDC048646]|uniref:hypothetical protein n=1 Tax=Lysinibacillus sp. NPDC048646 TaxID=3390574 RepID=UPI003D04119A